MDNIQKTLRVKIQRVKSCKICFTASGSYQECDEQKMIFLWKDARLVMREICSVLAQLVAIP